MTRRTSRDHTPRSLVGVLAALSLLVFATAPLAANIDYEGVALGSVPGNQLAFDGPLYVSTVGVTDIEDGASCAPSCPDNGTKYQLTSGSGFSNLVFISADPDVASCTPNCARFDVFTIDIAEPSPGSGPVNVAISIPGGAQFLFETDGVADGPGGAPDFETVALPETFRDVEQIWLLFTTLGLGIAIDNIIVEPESVPAPAGLGALALVLCLAGARAMGFCRFGRMRRSQR